MASHNNREFRGISAANRGSVPKFAYGGPRNPTVRDSNRPSNQTNLGYLDENSAVPAGHQLPAQSYHDDSNRAHLSTVSRRTSGSHYVSGVDSIYTNMPPYDDDDKISELDEYDHYDLRPEAITIRRATSTKLSKPLKSSLKKPKTMSNLPLRESNTLPAYDHSMTQGATHTDSELKTSLKTRPSISRASTEPQVVRMPFATKASSPNLSPVSSYTDITTHSRRPSAPMSSFFGLDTYPGRPSPIAEMESDYEKSKHLDLPSPMSQSSGISSNRLINPDYEKKGMSDKIPANKRPPRLNMGMVKDMQARGSLTSLSDLIKRATRVATNLEHGRTASRLDHLDMFGSSEKLPRAKVRDSTYSDMLSSFPAPAEGTPSRERPNTMWPHGNQSKSSLNQMTSAPKARRKCCGLSPIWFMVVVVIVTLLVVAAVLVPVFLVLLPKMHAASNGMAKCEKEAACQNGGISTFINGSCSCICVNGFTDSKCSTSSGPDCMSASLSDGTTVYDKATLGTSVYPLMNTAQLKLGIPLNTSIILSKFSSNDMSCSSENSLVTFSSVNAQAGDKRWVAVPEMDMQPELSMPESDRQAEEITHVTVTRRSHKLRHVPTATIKARQESTNGIVFASSTDGPSAMTVTTTSSGGIATATDAASPSSVPFTALNITDTQLEFASLVVLYVFEQYSVTVAVGANQALSLAFKSLNSDSGDDMVDVLGQSGTLMADLNKLELRLENGTTLGGVAGR